MAGYEISIKKEKEEIKLTTLKEAVAEQDMGDIRDVVFKMNTLDNNALNHADAARCEIIVHGFITGTNKQETLKLLNWSMDDDQKTLYREVELSVYQDKDLTGKELRTYQFDKMFVIDYVERYGKDDNGEFTLWIAQKAGIKTRKVI